MNKRLIIRLLGFIVLIEALAILPSIIIALCYNDPRDASALCKTLLLLCACGIPMVILSKPTEQNLRAREGFLVVALAWVLLSAFGALPLMFSGLLPNYIDAFFESVSGFTTTGASVLTRFDHTPHGVMFWRSFTHWIGGMGVLVLTLALLPQMTLRSSHLVRAESPGPSLSKIVPKMGDTAKILYLIYGAMTLLQFAALWIAGLSPYDAGIHAMGTAGTGGFSNYAASVGTFNDPIVETIITVFMLLFGVNFALYYRALTGNIREALKSEELHWYFGIVLVAMGFVTCFLWPRYGDFLTALRYGSFQVASVISTTGFITADFNIWPIACRMMLMLIMLIGSCAGSTAGGLKTVRFALLCKMGRREIRHTFQPRKVQVICFEGKGVENDMLRQIAVFFFVYVALVLAGAFAISLEGRFDMETNFTAALTCVSNVGPGLGAVGPTGSFAGYGAFAKLTLSLLMLAGRLELFPILVLLHPAVWRKQ